MRKLSMTAMVALSICLLPTMSQAETRWTPSVGISAIQDDNVLFSRTDPEDDYIYEIEPGLKLDSTQELTKISADGRVAINRYQDNDELDDEKYRFDLEGDSKLTERFNLRGSYEFIKDTTLDSELLEIGRIFVREDRASHKAKLTPSFNLNERTRIGLTGGYRNVTYESDSNVDYSAWNVGLPVRYRLATQVDSISIIPGYTHRDSDSSQSDSYNLRLGWDHNATERLKMNLVIGARYTEHENMVTGDTDENWSGLGALKFTYDFQTGRFKIDLQQDLQNTASGEQVNVSRVILNLRWNFTERMGMELRGRYYNTQTEGEINDTTTEFIQAGSDLFYHLTQNHIAFIAYEYSQDNQKDIEDEPRAERNRIWAGIRLNFPI